MNAKPMTREHILKTAARLFAVRGFHAVGISELCAELKLSRGAFYHHVESKEDLLEDICCRYMEQLCETGRACLLEEEDPVIRLKRLGAELLAVVRSNRPELTVCFREIQSLSEARRKKVLALHSTYEKCWRETWRQGAEKGVFLPYQRTKLKALLGMYYYSYLWLDERVEESEAEVAAMMHGIVADAVQTAEAATPSNC